MFDNSILQTTRQLKCFSFLSFPKVHYRLKLRSELSHGYESEPIIHQRKRIHGKLITLTQPSYVLRMSLNVLLLIRIKTNRIILEHIEDLNK